MIINSKNLVIFDLDGTLIDSAELVLHILNLQRANMQKELLDKKKLSPWISLGGEDLISNALDVPKKDCKRYVNEFREIYLNLKTPESLIFPGVVRFLDILIRNNKIITLCTNKPRKLVQKSLQDTSLKKYFDFFVAGDDLNSKKPDIKNLLKCMNYYGVSKEKTLFIGDSKIDQKLANKCEVEFWFFSSGYNDGVDLSLANFTFDSYLNFNKGFNE